VNFGTRGGKATHIFLWDRENAAAYLAPRESAMRFLAEQNLPGQIPSPVVHGSDTFAELSRLA
jgi:hypothetical protein